MAWSSNLTQCSAFGIHPPYEMRIGISSYIGNPHHHNKPTYYEVLPMTQGVQSSYTYNKDEEFVNVLVSFADRVTVGGTGVQEFERFYQENLGLIYRFVYSKVRNREEAEDITSRIFLKAVRGLDFKRDVQSTQAWLFQVARTTIVDYWRAHYRAAAGSLEDLLEAGWEGPVEQEPALMGNRATERVHHILDALPEHYREVLTCRFLLNLSVRETASMMGLTEANVRVVQFRALKRAANVEPVATGA